MSVPTLCHLRRDSVAASWRPGGDVPGFAASNGLLIHKRFEDAQGKVLAEGNAVLPPEAQTIQLEGKPAEPLLPAKKK